MPRRRGQTGRHEEHHARGGDHPRHVAGLTAADGASAGAARRSASTSTGAKSRRTAEERVNGSSGVPYPACCDALYRGTPGRCNASRTGRGSSVADPGPHPLRIGRTSSSGGSLGHWLASVLGFAAVLFTTRCSSPGSMFVQCRRLGAAAIACPAGGAAAAPPRAGPRGSRARGVVAANTDADPSLVVAAVRTAWPRPARPPDAQHGHDIHSNAPYVAPCAAAETLAPAPVTATPRSGPRRALSAEPVPKSMAAQATAAMPARALRPAPNPRDEGAPEASTSRTKLSPIASDCGARPGPESGGALQRMASRTLGGATSSKSSGAAGPRGPSSASSAGGAPKRGGGKDDADTAERWATIAGRRGASSPERAPRPRPEAATHARASPAPPCAAGAPMRRALPQ